MRTPQGEKAAVPRKRLEGLHRHDESLCGQSASRSYRDAVTAKCRELLTTIVNSTLAVRYVVALGRRERCGDLLPEYIEKNVLEVRDD